MHNVARLPTPAKHGDSQHSPELNKRRRRTLRLVGFGVVIAVAFVAGLGAWGYAQRRTAVFETLSRQENFVPVVRTSEVTAVNTPRELSLPGTTQAFGSATVYARATGYIARRLVDIGTRVKTGDVLAIIAAPELDQQLAQARAQLTQLQAAVVQARANADLARATNERTSKLVGQGWLSKQQGDNDRLTAEAQGAAVRVAEANLEAQRAVVSRLQELTSFERVLAPFEGTITSRQIDMGSLVTADVSSGTPLFSIDQTDVLRVQVYVPQDSVFGIKVGDEAQISVPELPGKAFRGKVARTASALQPGTRTLLTEVDVDNSEGALYAGLYCIVRFSLPRAQPAIIVPSQAIIFDKKGLSAAVYQDGVAHLRHLNVARDDGAEVELRAGLEPGDRVILNPPVGISEGMRVKSSAPDQSAKTAAH
jgi:RND family efflux transporter MFP subunit